MGGDDDFAVNHTALGRLALDRGDQFGKVAGHRPLVSAAQLNLVAVAEACRPESSPFGLIGPPGWDRRNCFASIGETGGITGSFIGSFSRLGDDEFRAGLPV
jgi:hypothetical protein